MVIVQQASTVNNGVSMTMRINGDTAGNYSSFGNAYTQNRSANTYAIQALEGAATSIPLVNTGGATDGNITQMSAFVQISGATQSGVKQYNANTGYNQQTIDGMIYRNFGGFWNNSATISSISIISSSGNFDAGTVFVYGA